MAEPRRPVPLALVVAVFSRYPDALRWGRERLEQEFGSVALVSTPFRFDQTGYYEATMGPDLLKQFLVHRDLVDPGRLAEIKLRTNALERELADTGLYPEVRPVNLDPGLLALGKFVLATT